MQELVAQLEVQSQPAEKGAVRVWQPKDLE